MSLSQSLLLGNFPKFMDVLTGQPGGLPNVHVAVVSSDTGAGTGSIFGCSTTGDMGLFQVAPRGSCTSTTLNAGATFISNEDGATNYTAPSISAVFTCIAPLGEAGCGFEHQLASVARALGADGAPAPAENQGFLRPDADLAIIFITNEDDCSAPANSLLYDTLTNTNLASQLGPPGNFRCNEFGHLCGSPPAPPRRISPTPSDLNTTVAYDGCQSAEDSAFLTPVGTFVSQIKALKTNPAAQILVEAMAGPPTPYAVHWSLALATDTGPWPAVVHSCDGGPTVGYANPAVRIAQFVQAFGANGSLHTICSNDFTPALQKIKDDITRVLADDGTGGAGGNGGSSGPGSGGEGGALGGHGGSSGAAGAAGGHGGGAGAIAGGGGSGGTAGGAGGSAAAGAGGHAGVIGSAGHGGASGTTGGGGAAAGKPVAAERREAAGRLAGRRAPTRALRVWPERRRALAKTAGPPAGPEKGVPPDRTPTLRATHGLPLRERVAAATWEVASRACRGGCCSWPSAACEADVRAQTAVTDRASAASAGNEWRALRTGRHPRPPEIKARRQRSGKVTRADGAGAALRLSFCSSRLRCAVCTWLSQQGAG